MLGVGSSPDSVNLLLLCSGYCSPLVWEDCSSHTPDLKSQVLSPEVLKPPAISLIISRVPKVSIEDGAESPTMIALH